MLRKSLCVLLSFLLTFLFAGCSVSESLDPIYVQGITYTGDYYEEVVIPAHAMGEGWPAPGAGNVQSGYVYLFADQALAINEVFLHFTIQMPHSWKEGTDVIPNIRFLYNSDQVGTVARWKIAYSWANVGDNFPVSSNIWVLTDAANNDSLKHQIVKFAPISGAGKEIGSTLMCYLSRNSSDATDNYTDTIKFVSVGLAYQVDAPGSTSVWVK